MYKSSILAIFAALFILGCATEKGTSKGAEAEAKPSASSQAEPACVTNFSIQGGFWAGQKISTFQEFPTKTASGAFDSLLPAIATRGYQIVSSSKEAGLISASSGVGWSSGGKTIPLNVSIKKIAPSGIRVDVVLVASGGLVTHNEQIQATFCKLMESVAQSAGEAVAAPTPAPAKQPTTRSKSTKPSN